MAPEQVQKGRTVDRRADVWALGVCLHELASGKLPYDGDDDIEVINKLLSDEAPKLAEGVPEPIARVLERSVVLDPDSRFPTAAGMQRAIEAAMKELGETTTSEDVAAFLRSEMPELAGKRKEVVNRAVDDARERGTPPAGSDPDVAFAPTIMSERQPRTNREGGAAIDRVSDAGTIALSKRKGPAPALGEPPPPTEASVALDQEPIKIPKTSKAWLWVTLVLVAAGGGVYYRWPGEVRGFFAKVGIGGGTTETGGQVAVPTEPSATAATAAPPATTSVPPAVSATATAMGAPPSSASAVESPSAHPSAAPSSSHGGAPSATHHTWPGGHEAPSASAAPSAAPAPTSTWSPYKQPPPATSTDNPYPGTAPPL